MNTDDESENREVEREFDSYIQENVKDYLNDCIFGGYFADGSKSWHDR